MISKEDFQSFSNIFYFENRLEDNKADYFSVTKDFIWRRDSARLVALKLDKEIPSNFNYLLNDLSLKKDEEVEAFDISSNGDLELKLNNKKSRTIKPIESSWMPNSLKTVYENEFDWQIEVESKFIAKQILMIQRKLMNLSSDLRKFNIVLDFQNQKYWIEGFEDDKRELLCKVKKVGNEPIVVYSFLFFKDFLINSQQLNKTIELKIRAPYFTLIKYTDKVYTIINHKRKRETEY